MGFIKTQKTEKSEVVSAEKNQQINDTLKKLGKTSATDLTEEELAEIRRISNS